MMCYKFGSINNNEPLFINLTAVLPENTVGALNRVLFIPKYVANNLPARGDSLNEPTTGLIHS